MIDYESIMINYERSLGKNEKCLKRGIKTPSPNGEGVLYYDAQRLWRLQYA